MKTAIILNRALKNAGDYFILESSRKLLAENGFQIKAELPGHKPISSMHYGTVNSSDYLVIAGGPCIQRDFHPRIYPLIQHTRQLQCKLLLLGVGLGANSDALTKKSISVLERAIVTTRDVDTATFLFKYGIDAMFTGCSSWFHASPVTSYKTTYDNVLITTAPGHIAENIKLIDVTLRLFPNAKITCTFNRGLGRGDNPPTLDIVNFCERRGIEVVNLEGGATEMVKLCGQSDFHIGARVHSHIACVTQGVKSILTIFDKRGMGQSRALGTAPYDIYFLGKLNGSLPGAVNRALGSDYMHVAAQIERQRTFIQRYLRKLAK